MSINKPLNLQIAGEGRPYIKNTKDKFWSAVSLPWMSIGYEVALTPLQLLTLYNAVANDGKMVKPVFVKEIRRNGQVTQIFSPVVINPSICSRATIEKAKTLLEGVVKEGTATAINTPSYKIAGKTGTAQLAQDNKGYNQGTKAVKYKGSFVGYFPADNPQYSIIIVINEPSKGKYYGASIAAPVFREISDRIYASLDNISNPIPYSFTGSLSPKTNGGAYNDIEKVYSFFNIPINPSISGTKWVRPVRDSVSVKLEPAFVSRNSMPDVRGMGVKDAVYILEQAGLRVVINGKGSVIRQSIQPGHMFLKGSIVIIDLAT
jgi:cell division protein FtsI (penicillin-binding protein 3)